MELAGRLAESGLDFVFKWGTCLVASVRPIRRVSIDVDIMCMESTEKLEEALTAITRDQPPFRDFEYQNWRAKENPPLKYYRILCDSVVEISGQTHVQLDLMLEKHYYPPFVECPLNFPEYGVESKSVLKIPSHSALLADKLSAFAPETIGYHYQPEKGSPDPLRMVKHLFDIGVLFEQHIDLGETLETYRKVFEIQNKAKGGGFTLEDALMDTYKTAFLAATLKDTIQKAKRIDDKYFFDFSSDIGRQSYLKTGISNLKSHLVRNNFPHQTAAEYAGRAAVMVACMIQPPREATINNLLEQHLASPEADRNKYFTGNLEKLNRLSRAALPAYKLWVLADRILNQKLKNPL